MNIDNRIPANERVRFCFGFIGITNTNLKLGVRNFVIRHYERTDKHVCTYNNTVCKKGITKMAAVRHFKFISNTFKVVITAFFCQLALRPNAGHDFLIHVVSRSHTMSRHSR